MNIRIGFNVLCQWTNLLIYELLIVLFIGTSRGSPRPEAWWQVYVLRVQQSDKSCIGKVRRSPHYQHCNFQKVSGDLLLSSHESRNLLQTTGACLCAWRWLCALRWAAEQTGTICGKIITLLFFFFTMFCNWLLYCNFVRCGICCTCDLLI